MFIAIGVSFAYNGGHALTLSGEPDFFWLGQGHIGPVPVLVIVVAGLAIVLHLLLKRTRTGLRMYAVGGSVAAARLRGVSRGRAIILGSILAGGVAGLSGVLFASYGYGASALGTGLDFLITALAAAFLGSALSRTGELDVLWAVVASIFLAAISSGLILLGASNQVLPGIQGAILIASIVPGVIRRRDIGQVLIF
jgi:ribose transport system ATP-binding protein